ncbi:hypothetical protein MAR_023738 [Mya arenaria]|uniref:Retrotransposon gag domain-containing protein n=1 Tax=Mya arenaria TaxID=6604 RepID=A0ABY7DWP8_MYAAR|nr:hypothetical protein MAR_023738 [Mya arenaria]
MTQLENDYVTLESSERLMHEFYACEQRSSESVHTYASRLEDLFDQAVNLRTVRFSKFLVLMSEDVCCSPTNIRPKNGYAQWLLKDN